MAIRTGSISPGNGSADFDTIVIDGDYTAPLPIGAVLAIYVDATNGSVTVDLPEKATGKAYVIKKIDATANQVVVDVENGGRIDGVAATIISLQNESYFVQWESIGRYYIDADYNPAGSAVIPTLQQVTIAGNETLLPITAATYSATGTVLYSSPVSFNVDPNVFDYRFDMNAIATTITATLPTGAAVNGKIFAFHCINSWPVGINAVNVRAPAGGTINGQPPANIFPVSVIYETLILKCVSNTGDYIRLSPCVRINQEVIAYTTALPVAIIPLTHRLTTQPTTANIAPANAVAAGLLAGGNWWLTFAPNVVQVNFPAPVGPFVGAQFYLQAWANR